MEKFTLCSPYELKNSLKEIIDKETGNYIVNGQVLNEKNKGVKDR